MACLNISRKLAPGALFLALLGCSSGDDSADDDSTDQGSTQSGGPSTSGGTSSGGPSGNDTGAATSGSDASSSATSGGQTNGTSSTGASNGAGGGGSEPGSTNTTDADSSSSGGDCEQVSCLRPYECAASCDAEPTYIGCCPCSDDQVDQFIDCNQAGDDCGGTPCQENEYCEKPVGECDASDAEGTCAPMPGGCTLEYVPVCGCDGVTYGNSCGAAAAGVNIAATAECE